MTAQMRQLNTLPAAGALLGVWRFGAGPYDGCRLYAVSSSGGCTITPKSPAAATVLLKQSLEERQREFTALVHPEWSYAVRYAQKYLYNVEDAQDIVTDAAVKAWRAFGTFRREMDFGNWFRAILHNAILDKLRSKRRTNEKAKRVHLPDELMERAATTELNAWGGMSEGMYFAIQKLEPRYQEALKLRFEDDRTLREISDAIGIPLNAARKLMNEAIAALKAALESEE